MQQSVEAGRAMWYSFLGLNPDGLLMTGNRLYRLQLPRNNCKPQILQEPEGVCIYFIQYGTSLQWKPNRTSDRSHHLLPLQSDQIFFLPSFYFLRILFPQKWIKERILCNERKHTIPYSLIKNSLKELTMKDNTPKGIKLYIAVKIHQCITQVKLLPIWV